MNSRTVMMIVILGGLGTLGLIIAAMMGFDQLLEKKPLIRAAVGVAEKHQVKEVTLAVVPATGMGRTIRLAYTTSVRSHSKDSENAEMEIVAKTAWEQVDKVEREMPLKREERLALGPIQKVEIRRTWRSERGCFKRSEEATHEWTPPLPPLR
jgi:hypothetical protein